MQNEKANYTEKIYVINSYLLDGIDTFFDDLTDAEVLALCENDKDMLYHNVYETAEALAGAWNFDEILLPSISYMRVIKIKNDDNEK